MDPTVCQSFISCHRDYFTSKYMDMKSIETIPVEKIILYFVHLLKYQHLHDNQDNPVKLFHPVPIQLVKRLSMVIDPEILYHMLNELDDDDLHYNNIKRDDFAYSDNAQYKYFFEKYFNFDRFESKVTERKCFNYSRGITTNGVKLSFLYIVSTEVEAGPAHQRKSSQRYLFGTFCQHNISVCNTNASQLAIHFDKYKILLKRWMCIGPAKFVLVNVAFSCIVWWNISMAESMIFKDSCGVAAESAEIVHSKIVMSALPAIICSTNTWIFLLQSWIVMEQDGLI
jgi:hypothetical protein